MVGATDIIIDAAGRKAMAIDLIERPGAFPPEIIEAATKGDQEALDKWIAWTHAVKAESVAADHFIQQYEKENQVTLSDLAIVKVRETFAMVMAARRMSCSSANAPWTDERVSNAMKVSTRQQDSDPFRILVCWRFSDRDSEHQDFTETGLDLIDQTWDMFGKSQYSHASPSKGNVDVTFAYRQGSAIASMVRKKGTDYHALWEDLVPTFDRADRIIVLGDDGVAADKTSLLHIFARTTADLVFAHANPQTGSPDFEILTAQRFRDGLLTGVGPENIFRSIEAGAVKRYLIAASSTSRQQQHRYRFAEVAAREGWQQASVVVPPSDRFIKMKCVERSLGHRQNVRTYNLDDTGSAKEGTEDAQPAKKRKTTSTRPKQMPIALMKAFCPMLYADCAQATEAAGEGQKHQEDRLDYVVRHHLAKHSKEKACPWTGSARCAGLRSVTKTTAALREHFAEHERQQPGVW
ncbi:unnamed protein product [Sympodiomycopsis kandeliae]